MYKMRLVFAKEGSARFISHLDLMKVFQRSFSRSGLPVWYTEGFNRHMYVAIALPLPVGFCGEREILDFQLDLEGPVPEDALARINRALPPGITGIELDEVRRPVREIGFGRYKIEFSCPAIFPEMAEEAEKILSDRELAVIKKSKSGEKSVLLREFMSGKPVCKKTGAGMELEITLSAGQETLSPAAVVNALGERMPALKEADVCCTRLCVLDKAGALFC